jgi:hypothetical protein
LVVVPSDRVIVWAFRAVWGALALLAGPALGDALADTSRPVQIVTSICLWAGWAVVLVASLVPTTVSLTVVRLVAPGAVAATVAAAFGGAGPLAAGIAVGATIAAALLAFLAELGLAFVRGSAYGDEDRLLLRPPGPLVLGPLPLAWLVLAAAVAAGPLLLATRQWIAGGVVTVLGVALAVLLGRRFHRLSQRWLVLVPAGLVLHDPLVLAETAMWRRGDVTEVTLAREGTQAMDLTGKALGMAVEVRLAGDGGTVVLAGTPRDRKGKAYHVRSFLCAPSRPGRAITDAARRGLPT